MTEHQHTFTRHISAYGASGRRLVCDTCDEDVPMWEYIEGLQRQLAEAQARIADMEAEHAVWEKHSLCQIVEERTAWKERAERAEADNVALRVALEALYRATFSGSDMRLMAIAVGGSNVRPELYEQCDRLDDTLRKTEQALAAPNPGADLLEDARFTYRVLEHAAFVLRKHDLDIPGTHSALARGAARGWGKKRDSDG